MKRASNPSPRTSKRHKNDAGSEVPSDATATRRSLRGIPGGSSSTTESEAASSSSDESEEETDQLKDETLPEWLISGLDGLKRQYPRDSFHGIFNTDGEARVICSDCPGTQYLPGENDTKNFALHLRNKKHRTKVTTRLSPYSTTFQSRLRYESFSHPSPNLTPRHSPSQESVPAAAAAAPDVPSKPPTTTILPPSKSALTGSGSGSGPITAAVIGNGNSGTPIRPTSVQSPAPPATLTTSTHHLTPATRIAQLEKGAREKTARIEDLEAEVRRLRSLVEGLLDREGKAGRGGEASTASTAAPARKSGGGGFGSFFGGVFNS